jgi:hypothetical protein
VNEKTDVLTEANCESYGMSKGKFWQLHTLALYGSDSDLESAEGEVTDITHFCVLSVSRNGFLLDKETY